jgi:hypothetical protein
MSNGEKPRGPMSPEAIKARLKQESARRQAPTLPQTPSSDTDKPASQRQQARAGLRDALKAAGAESPDPRRGSVQRETHVHIGAEHAADVIGVSGEIAEKLRTLENEVDEKIIKILEIINTGATVALDGESYAYDPDTDAITAPKKNPNLIESLEKKEKILRELAASVKDLPAVIEEILKLKDMTHSLLAPTLKKLEK